MPFLVILTTVSWSISILIERYKTSSSSEINLEQKKWYKTFIFAASYIIIAIKNLLYESFVKVSFQ